VVNAVVNEEVILVRAFGVRALNLVLANKLVICAEVKPFVWAAVRAAIWLVVSPAKVEVVASPSFAI
jgi:hypothetical protein